MVFFFKKRYLHRFKYTRGPKRGYVLINPLHVPKPELEVYVIVFLAILIKTTSFLKTIIPVYFCQGDTPS